MLKTLCGAYKTHSIQITAKCVLNIIYIELFKIQYKINYKFLGGNVTDISLIAQEGLIVFNASKTCYLFLMC